MSSRYLDLGRIFVCSDQMQRERCAGQPEYVIPLIEVKIYPRDEATQQQVAGLALIARHFVEHGVSVSTEIMALYGKGSKPPWQHVEEQYCNWYKKIREIAMLSFV